MGCALHTLRIVDSDVGNFPESLAEIIFQAVKSFRILFQMVVKHFCRLCHTRNAGHVFGTGTQVFLLAAAVNNVVDFYFFSDIQETDALRAVNFVTAYGQEVNAHTFGVNAVFAEALHRIHMEQGGRVRALNKSARFRNRLHSTDFIVGVHYGY